MNLNLVNDKFWLEFDHYNPAWVSQIHGIPGGRWNSEARVWVLPKDLETLQAIVTYFPFVKLSDSVQEWKRNFLAKIESNLVMKNMPAPLIDWSAFSFNPLYPPFKHQLIGAEILISNKHFALTMDMGCGKTATEIYFLSYLKSKGIKVKCLIVAPLTILKQWGKEINKHSIFPLSYSILLGSKFQRLRELEKQTDIHIVNYDYVHTLLPQLEKKGFNVIICDEMHKIKNRTALQSKACYKIGKLCLMRHGLTGTTITNNPLDVFGQFKFINEEILGSNYFGFQNRYAIMVTNGRARFPVRFINLDELAQRIKPWVYRVTKKECLDLPDKNYETRTVSLDGEAKILYKTLAKELAAWLDTGELVTAPIVITKLLRFSQICSGFIKTEMGETKEVKGSGKLKELEDIVSQCEGKLVIWTRFKKELSLVTDMLGANKVSYLVLDGDTPQDRRQEILDRFQDTDVKVFVSNIQAGGIGINLTSANTCVFMSNPYSLGLRLQAEDRLHRIGQKHPVTYIDIVCEDSIDEKILQMINQKQDLADIINGATDMRSFVKELILKEEVNNEHRGYEQ